jgi:hypothetical protein
MKGKKSLGTPNYLYIKTNLGVGGSGVSVWTRLIWPRMKFSDGNETRVFPDQLSECDLLRRGLLQAYVATAIWVRFVVTHARDLRCWAQFWGSALR